MKGKEGRDTREGMGQVLPLRVCVGQLGVPAAVLRQEGHLAPPVWLDSGGLPFSALHWLTVAYSGLRCLTLAYSGYSGLQWPTLAHGALQWPNLLSYT